MTAEIAVANRSAVALAADSAATLQARRGPKIFSANKIFSLSSTLPIGIMVYGAAAINGMPWETIIKEFRSDFGTKSFGSISEAARIFTKFAENFVSKSPEIEWSHAEYLISTLCRQIEDEARKFAAQSGVAVVVPEHVGHAAKKILNSLKDRGAHAELSSRAVSNKFRTEISEIVDVATKRFKLVTAFHKRLIRQAIITKLISSPLSAARSGLVLAGFGAKEKFPQINAFEIDQSIASLFKKNKNHHFSVSETNSSCIHAFAQKDVVENFLEGIHPNMREMLFANTFTVLKKLPEIFLSFYLGKPADQFSKDDNKKIADFTAALVGDPIKNMVQQAQHFSEREFSQPIVSMVDHFDKDQLAVLAESLVNITALRRRVSFDQETVGGPIDVAVISKHDGFVWIKRKHYFNLDLNLDFRSRRLQAHRG